MLVYDWMWWGQLTNQIRAWRCAEGCTEVRGGVHGGFLLDNILSQSVCISLEYHIKGVSIFLLAR